MKEENLTINEGNFDQHIVKRSFSLIAVNYAFQNTISWGGGQWQLKEKDLEEIKECIDVDIEKTGKQIWAWFRKGWKDFYTQQSDFDRGTEFFRQLKRYYA